MLVITHTMEKKMNNCSQMGHTQKKKKKKKIQPKQMKLEIQKKNLVAFELYLKDLIAICTSYH